MEHYLNYIDGQWCDNASHLTIMNPSTDEPFATIAKADINDTNVAMAAARQCVKSGSLSDVRPAERTKWLLQIAAAIRDVTEEGALICCRENGKSLNDSRGEFTEAARYFEYYAGMADKIEGISVPLGKDYIDFTQYVPFGVSVQIVPWNFPTSICARSLAPALAAGNAVVVKSPEISPAAMTILFKAITSTDLPKGAVNLLCGEGSVVGAHLVKHPETNQIVFTGSVPTGQRILQDAAIKATPSVMELGGKSAAIVFEDADLKCVIDSVQSGIYFNAGQVCSAMSRLLVTKNRYEEVKSAVVEMANSLTIGQGEDNPDLTPLVSHDQQQRVLQMIEQAKADGAKILAGGEAPDCTGYFVQATVIEATPDMAIAREEIFGPVLVIMPFDTEQQAVEIANNTDFGLVSGIFGESISQTLRVANQLRGGQVFVNEWYAGGIETPFGGVGLSGFGREKGQEAIYSYVQTRNIAIRLQPAGNKS